MDLNNDILNIKNMDINNLLSSWQHFIEPPSLEIGSMKKDFSSNENSSISRSQSSSNYDYGLNLFSLTPHINSSARFKLAVRRSSNKSGRLISLYSNHFQVLSSNKTIYEYSVHFLPSIPSKKLNRKILKCLEQQYPDLKSANIVFDGWNTIYTTSLLDVGLINQLTVSQNGLYTGRDSSPHFHVSINFKSQFSLSINETENRKRMVHAIDTILRQQSCDQFNVVLQSFFSTTPQLSSNLNKTTHGLGWGTVNLGIGREVCYGFYQSVAESFDVVTMNLDVATTTFYRPIHMVEFLAEVLGVPIETVTDGRPLSEINKKKFSKEVIGIKVETRHCETPRRYRVERCTLKPTANIMLTITHGDDEKEISIAQYYKQRYNITLQYLHLPCFEVGKFKKCILPLELCYTVAGQRCIKKLSEQQISNLIKATSRNAQERKEAVLKIRDQVEIAEDSYSVNYGITVDRKMMKIDGRVLPPPKLLYRSPINHRQECVTIPNNGAWDMRGKNFYNGIRINRWAVVCFANSVAVTENHLRGFVSNLNKVAKEIGMPFVNGPSFCKYALPDQAAEILKHLQYESHQLIVCVVPGKSSIYGELKRKGDLLGLTTQCIRVNNVLKASAHTLSNLCMKINSKLGGVNLIVSPPASTVVKEPTLFVGCYISRSSLNGEYSCQAAEKSICCLVGSLDGHPTRFSPVIRVQNRSLCFIQDIEEMMKEVIINFYKATTFKPHRLVIYRSGVTDGVIDDVLQFELRGIRNACLSIDPNFQPGVTIIGLDVTHHTRLFATHDSDRMGNSLNVPAGTLVETGITVNNLFEFYLVSHAGIQGTSRPTKYTVMWDDNEFSGETVHELTYQLCHTQSRCTRSVSIPSPVYYAKLVAQRAKILMSEENFTFDKYKEISINSEGMLFT